MLKDLILDWAKDRGILDVGTVWGQMDKLYEEVDELSVAIKNSDRAEIRDAIGDIQVVLIILSELLEEDSVKCLEGAYDVIKQRKGKMVDGVFVKEE